jgi:HSP20 family protein
MADKTSPKKEHAQAEQKQTEPRQTSPVPPGSGTSMTPTRRQEMTTRGGFPSLFRLRDEFDRLFDQFFRGWPTMWEPTGHDYRWDLDVQDNDDAVVVRAEAPGFEPGDFDLEVRGDQLVLRAEHKAQSEEKERGYREWRRQEFYRSVPLPAHVDPNKVEASYRNGVLNVSLPKTEHAKAKRIEVKG